MNIHEFQGKQLLQKFGVPVPQGGVAKSSAEAVAVAKKLKSRTDIFVVKSQIHAGGRGKGTVYSSAESGRPGRRTKVLEGGVKLAKTIDEVRAYASKILGNILVTHQSGSEGRTVRQVLIEEGMDISKELYLGAVLDWEHGQWVIMLSTEGGMEIEVVADKWPEKIHKVYVDPALGLLPFQVKELVYSLKINNKQVVKNLMSLIPNFFNCFLSCDCSICEINPLVILKNNSVVALDAKLNFDDNALFRHPELLNLRDEHEESPLEIEAGKHNLNYIKLNGNIGCMVNGAGLAMATMDIIKYAGGEPANFLDVGGGVTKDGVVNAFKIILKDKAVKGIFVNIFGGIAKCDLIAQGIVEAAKEIDLNLPCVVRLDGTNVEVGRKIISNSEVDFLMAETMSEGAQKIVQAIKKPPQKKHVKSKTLKKTVKSGKATKKGRKK